MAFVSSQVVSMLPTARPDHPKAGPFTAGTDQASIWSKGWDQEAIWAAQNHEAPKAKQSSDLCPCIQYARPIEKARRQCETALKENGTDMGFVWCFPPPELLLIQDSSEFIE